MSSMHSQSKRISRKDRIRQRAMNDPRVRAQAFAILACLYESRFDSPEHRLREHAMYQGEWTLAHDLAGLLLEKPNAPWGQEVWS